MPLDALGELATDVAGGLLRQAGGLAIDLTVDHVFSRHTARFFHGVGRRTIALVTLGRWRIASSLRLTPRGTRPRPRRNDWIALAVGILVWVALFVGLGMTLARLL